MNPAFFTTLSDMVVTVSLSQLAISFPAVQENSNININTGLCLKAVIPAELNSEKRIDQAAACQVLPRVAETKMVEIVRENLRPYSPAHQKLGFEGLVF